jgi:hypothetical protein
LLALCAPGPAYFTKQMPGTPGSSRNRPVCAPTPPTRHQYSKTSPRVLPIGCGGGCQDEHVPGTFSAPGQKREGQGQHKGARGSIAHNPWVWGPIGPARAQRLTKTYRSSRAANLEIRASRINTCSPLGKIAARASGANRCLAICSDNRWLQLPLVRWQVVLARKCMVHKAPVETNART